MQDTAKQRVLRKFDSRRAPQFADFKRYSRAEFRWRASTLSREGPSRKRNPSESPGAASRVILCLPRHFFPRLLLAVNVSRLPLNFIQTT